MIAADHQHGHHQAHHEQAGRPGAQRDPQRQVPCAGLVVGDEVGQRGQEVHADAEQRAEHHEGGHRPGAVGVAAPAAQRDEVGEQPEGRRPTRRRTAPWGAGSGCAPARRRAWPAGTARPRCRSGARAAAPAAGARRPRRWRCRSGRSPRRPACPWPAERWSRRHVAQVVDQPHHELGHEHGRRCGEHLAGGSAHQCHEEPDHDREGQRLARMCRPEQAPQLSGCLARHLCAHGSQY